MPMLSKASQAIRRQFHLPGLALRCRQKHNRLWQFNWARVVSRDASNTPDSEKNATKNFNTWKVHGSHACAGERMTNLFQPISCMISGSERWFRDEHGHAPCSWTIHLAAGSRWNSFKSDSPIDPHPHT